MATVFGPWASVSRKLFKKLLLHIASNHQNNTSFSGVFVYFFSRQDSRFPKTTPNKNRDGSNQGHAILNFLLLDEFRASSALSDQS